MKKIFATALAILLVLSFLSACAKSGTSDGDESSKPSVTTAREGFEDVTAPPEDSEDTSADDGDTSADTSAAFGAEDAVAAARQWFGEVDEDTGFLYSYSFDEMVTEGGKEYYKIRVSWYLEEEDRYSLCGYLLVSEDGGVREYNW